MNILKTLFVALSAFAFLLTVGHAANSGATIPFKGKLSNATGPYNGNVHIKFSLYNASTSLSVWTNDGSALNVAPIEPTAATVTTASNGIFTAWMGDSTQTGMVALPLSTFNSAHLKLRVWISENGSTFTQMSPDKPMSAKPFAFRSHSAANAEQIAGTTPSTYALTLLSQVDAASFKTQLGLGHLTSSTGQDLTVPQLVVTSSANLSGLLMPSSDGTAGQVVVTDGAGNLGFATVSSGNSSLGDSSVTSAKILDGSVVAVDLADASVTSAKILDASITAADIADSSITSAKILDGTVATSDLADASVTSAKILDASITAADIADSSITSAKILGGTVATADLADASVTSAKILDGTVATADLADASVTSSKLDANITIGGTLTVVGSSNISGLLLPTSDGSANSFLMTNGTGNLSFGSANQILNSSTIASLSLTSPSITGATIVTPTISNGSLTGSTLSAVNVTGANLNNVSIGSTTPSTGTFTSANVTGTMFTGNIGVNMSAPTYGVHLPNTSATSGKGLAYAWLTYSSKVYKTEIVDIPHALDKVSQLRGVTYKSKLEHGGSHQIGFIAEEVEKVIPEVILYEKDGIRGMDYSRLAALNVQAINELSQKQDEEMGELKRENLELRRELIELKKLFSKMVKK